MAKPLTLDVFATYVAAFMALAAVLYGVYLYFPLSALKGAEYQPSVSVAVIQSELKAPTESNIFVQTARLKAPEAAAIANPDQAGYASTDLGKNGLGAGQ
jgi:hypothetical protein